MRNGQCQAIADKEIVPINAFASAKLYSNAACVQNLRSRLDTFDKANYNCIGIVSTFCGRGKILGNDSRNFSASFLICSANFSDIIAIDSHIFVRV